MTSLYWLMGTFALVALCTAAWLRLRRRGSVAPRGFAGRLLLSLPAMIVFGLTTVGIGLENFIEQHYLADLSWDFTPLIFSIEGHAVEAIQDAVRNRVCDWLLTIVYSLGAFLTYNGTFFACVVLGRPRAALMVAVSDALIWGTGALFYLFVPVNEVWMTADAPYHYTHVVNVLFQTLPATRTSPEYMMQLNNNFPSLHVAGTVGVTLALFMAREKVLFWICVPFAVGVTLATVYLGIHWLLDVAAGLALAWGATWLAARWTLRKAGPAAPASSTSR